MARHVPAPCQQKLSKNLAFSPPNAARLSPIGQGPSLIEDTSNPTLGQKNSNIPHPCVIKVVSTQTQGNEVGGAVTGFL